MGYLWKRLGELVHAVLRLGNVRALQNLGWLAGGQLAGDFTAFIFFILLSRSFGPEGVGDYAFAVAVASVGRTIASMGVDDFGVRELASEKSETTISVVGRILGAQCWLVVLYIAGCALFLAGIGVSTRTIVVVGLLTVYHLSAGVVRSLFLPAFAERRMAGPALLDTGSRILAVIGGILVMLFGNGTLIEVLIGFPICGVLLVMGAVWQTRRELGELHIQLNLDSVISTVKQAWPFAAGEVVFRLYSRADVVMLSLIVGSAATGIYAAGLKFVEVVMMVVALFAFALYPRLTRLAQNDEAGFEIAVNTLVKGGFVACVILGWGIFVLIPDLIPLFFGSQFDDAAIIVKLFALLVPLMGVNILGERLMLAAGHQIQRLRFQTFATVVNVVFNGILIPVLAVEGAVIASVVSFTVNAFLLVRFLQRYSSERLLWRLIVEPLPFVLVGLLAVGIVASFGTQEIWIAIVFMVSFLGAAVFSGFSSMIWTNVTRLAKRVDA